MWDRRNVLGYPTENVKWRPVHVDGSHRQQPPFLHNELVIQGNDLKSYRMYRMLLAGKSKGNSKDF